MIFHLCSSRTVFCLRLLVLAMLTVQASGGERIARAVFVEPPKNAPEKVFLVNVEGEAIEVPLPSRNFSPEVPLPQGDLVFAVSPRALAEGETVPKGAPVVKIPKAWTRCYLLFKYQKENKVFPLEVLPINASAGTFQEGHSRIVNWSEAMVRGRFGSKTVVIKPGKVENLDPPVREFGPYRVEIDYMMRGDKEPKPLARTSFQHDPLSRQLILITMPGGVKYPRIVSFQDRDQR